MRDRLIDRPAAMRRVEDSFRVHPAVALVGPRQCGKSTLARMIAGNYSALGVNFFDLESAVDRRRLESPEQALSPLRGLVVIDEIQRQQTLFETLRVLIDRPGASARFLVLGSASPTLMKEASETLAGRMGWVDLSGFDIGEVCGDRASADWHPLWVRGGFPRSFLAPDDASSMLWREDFVRTFLERDVPQLGLSIAAEALRRFWTMVAHYQGQVWNAAEFSRALGSSQAVARRYLDVLNGAYMVRVLQPWHENLKKRQVKAPKIYVRDSGLLHALLETPSLDALLGHPKVGASFEGFAIEQLLSLTDARSANFWATHGGAELDLLITVAGRRYGFEVKRSDAPAKTRSMHTAIADLGLEHLWVIYPGTVAYDLDDRLSTLPIGDLAQFVADLKAGKRS